jgi:hypothetical protein
MKKYYSWGEGEFLLDCHPHQGGGRKMEYLPENPILSL